MAAAWEYSCQNGWQKFPHEISSIVDSAYQRREKYVKYSIQDHNYRIVFSDHKQYRGDDPTKSRSVRRCAASTQPMRNDKRPRPLSESGQKVWSAARSFLLPADEEIVFFLRKAGLQRFIPFFHRQGARTVIDIKSLLNSRNVPWPAKMTALDKLRLQDALRQWGTGTLDNFFNMPHGDLSKGLPHFGDLDWKKILRWALAAGITVFVCARAWALLFPALAAAPAVAVAPAIFAADCIDEDAEVTQYDRSRKKIKDVQIGDDVLSFNNGRFLVKKVRDVKIGSSREMTKIQYQKSNGVESEIHVTPGHPMWVSRRGWAVIDPSQVTHSSNGQGLSKLSVGDKLLLGDDGKGESVLVTALHKSSLKRTTYNLIVDGPGTFFANGILMHSGLPPKK